MTVIGPRRFAAVVAAVLAFAGASRAQEKGVQWWIL